MESVSVIIPAYKAAATIGRAIESVVGQSAPPAEIIVVDDGSPDNISGALKPFGSQVTLVRKANGGAASARNHGIEHAKGDWIAFLDADDYWEPSKLEKQLAVAATEPAVGVLGSRWFEQTPLCQRELPKEWVWEFYGRTLMPRGRQTFRMAMCVWTSTVLVRRDVLAGLRFDSTLGTGEDRDLWIRLLSGTSVHLHMEPLATAVREPGSLSRSSVEHDCRNMLRVIHRHAGLLGRSEVRSQEAIVYARWAGNLLLQGNARGAMKPAVGRLRRQPVSPGAWWALSKSAIRMCISPAISSASADARMDDQRSAECQAARKSATELLSKVVDEA